MIKPGQTHSITPLCQKLTKTKHTPVRPTKKNKKERERAYQNHGRLWPWLLASYMPRPHMFPLDKLVQAILYNAVCTWFGRKLVETCQEQTLYNQARAKWEWALNMRQ